MDIFFLHNFLMAGVILCAAREKEKRRMRAPTCYIRTDSHEKHEMAQIIMNYVTINGIRWSQQYKYECLIVQFRGVFLLLLCRLLLHRFDSVVNNRYFSL